MDLLDDKRIKYRELQGIAKKMKLPGNLKYNLLVEVIRARREGKEHVVERILGDQKLERVRRKHEKLGSQESAYQHLRMTSVKGHSNMAIPRNYQNGVVMTPPPNVTALPHDHGMCVTNVYRHPPRQSSAPPQPWAGVTNIFSSDVRSILQMPENMFQSLQKQAIEDCRQRIHAAHRGPLSVTYGEWLKIMEQKKNPTLLVPNQQNYIEVSPSSTRDDSHYYLKEEEIPSADERKSFQEKGIISDCGNQANLGHINLNSSQYDWTQLPHEFPALVSDTLISHMQTYVPAVNTWRNIYDLPDSTFIEPQYVDYNVQQDPLSSGTSAGVSPQTSDTISATDEDLPKENGCELPSNLSMPFHPNYIVAPRQEDLDSNDTPYIVIDPDEEFNPRPQ